mmetsp:Transcript_146262/g.469124  ORF Transcript_146262/g.469124 Transcript_146262/m.469124 type:complete len:360 (-) Transcript_146262:680-1759(-)
MHGPSARIAQVLLVVQHEGGLRHREHDEVRAGVDGPGWAGEPSPPILTGARALVLLRVSCLDLPQEVVAHACFVENEHRLLAIARGGDVVGDHQLHRFPFEDADTIHLAKVPEHHQEAQIVVEGADHATPHDQRHVNRAPCGQHLGDIGANPAALLTAFVDDLELMCQVRLALDLHALVPRADPVRLVLGNREVRVPHLEGAADALLQRNIEGLAKYHLHHSAEDIEAVAVIPEMPWLPFEWHFRKSVAPVLQVRDGAGFGFLAKLLVDLVVGPLLWRPRIVKSGSIADARGVRQQLAQGDGSLQRLALLLPALGQDTHLRGRKGRDVLGDRVIQIDATSRLLPERHERCRHQALGHRE